MWNQIKKMLLNHLVVFHLIYQKVMTIVNLEVTEVFMATNGHVRNMEIEDYVVSSVQWDQIKRDFSDLLVFFHLINQKIVTIVGIVVTKITAPTVFSSRSAVVVLAATRVLVATEVIAENMESEVKEENEVSWVP